MRFSCLAKAACLATSMLSAVPALAADDPATQLPPIDAAQAQGASVPDDAALARARAHGADTASLLAAIPGVAIATGGGFSGMPTVHGLTEQRLTILVDGAPVPLACPNDMNTPLSYTDPQTIGAISVITGVSPVSLGGDGIGAVIAVDGPAPRFAQGGGTLVTGMLAGTWRSNGDGVSTAAALTVADAHVSATYSGSFTTSGRYRGGGEDGVVRSSEYRKFDHALALAAQGGFGLAELKLTYHHSPYEGFVNQYMDMTDNTSWSANGHWVNDFGGALVDLRADYRAVDHEMNFLADKGGMADGGMPMNTRVRSGGGKLKVDVPLGTGRTLRGGGEYRRETLADWWPAVAGSTMMGPDTYLNVNGGERARMGLFGEFEGHWADRFSLVAGLRADRVVMNTGQVAPYSWTSMMSMADAMAAAAFSAADHRRTDTNWSGSLIARYTPAPGVSVELGYARKARSPNLYERYTWGRGAMSSSMIGWYGDGNGYVGNLDLKPERADTVSLAVEAAQGVGGQGWSLRLAPWYTRVHDYIDATWLKDMTDMMGMATGFSQLQFANVEAELYGVDLSGAMPLWDGGKWGKTRLTGALAWTHGENLSSHTPLYRQQPLTLQAALAHRAGAFETGLDLRWTARKTRVDPIRGEPETPGFALLGIDTAYTFKAVRLSLAVENLLDKAYALPLGGLSLGDYSASGGMVKRAVPGRGRSLALGLSTRF